MKINLNQLKIKLKAFKKAVLTSPLEFALLALMAASLLYSALPTQALADSEASIGIANANKAVELEIAAMQNELVDYGVLPKSDLRGPAYTMIVPATSYNSLPGQTDSTPDITASGTHTRWGVVAANFLPIGTRIKIPELYGDQIFIIEDRMNARYWTRIDIWMENYQDSVEFGIRNVKIEVYPNK
jgi:3D (Asp-Asp-Asp) domain-containing protein